MKKENKVQAYVQLYLNDVELNISVSGKLKRQKGNLENFGFIEVSFGTKDSTVFLGDNLNYFIDCDKESFKIECGHLLKDKDYNVRETFKDVKRLIQKAIKLNLLTIDGEI